MPSYLKIAAVLAQLTAVTLEAVLILVASPDLAVIALRQTCIKFDIFGIWMCPPSGCQLRCGGLDTACDPSNVGVIREERAFLRTNTALLDAFRAMVDAQLGNRRPDTVDVCSVNDGSALRPCRWRT